MKCISNDDEAQIRRMLDTAKVLGTVRFPDCAQLDGSDQPFTGDLQIYKADPTLTLKDSGNDKSTWLTRADTVNKFSLVNQTLGQGSQGYAISLNGTDEGASVADNVNHDMETSDYTFAIWLKTTIVSGTKTIFAKRNAAGGILQWGLDNASSNVRNYFRTSTSGVLTVSYAWTNINDGNWHLIVGTYDRDGYMRLYTDGVERGVAVDISAYSAVNMNNGLATTIGVSADAAGYLAGTFDEAAIWKGRVLTAGEVLDMWNSGAGLYLDPASTFASSGTLIGTSLISLYHLDSTAGVTATDSVSAINMTITNVDASNWVAGLFNIPGLYHDVEVFSVQDGGAADEYAIITEGDSNSRKVINGKSVRLQVGGVEQARLDDGVLTPTTDNDIDLGSSTKEFKDVYADGILRADAIYQDDNEAIAFGTEQDATIKYDGTNLLINPKVVGTGIVDIAGVLQVDGYNAADASPGVSGSFTTVDLKTVTVKDGIITAIV
jgi:hypothetical protein